MKLECPNIPDASKLSFVNSFCLNTLPYTESKNQNDLFFQAMSQIVDWHIEKSDFYQKLCANQNFCGSRLLESHDLATLPLIPAEFFKWHEIKSIASREVFVHLTSSGTSGQKSQIFFDQWSLTVAQRMVSQIFLHYGWVDSEPVDYLLYSYEPRANFNVGTSFTDNYLCQYAPVASVTYALRNNGLGDHDFDLYGCIRALSEFSQNQNPVRIFGFPAFFYFTLKKREELGLKPLSLHPKSFVFLGGGWKKNSREEINKAHFYKLIQSQLGIAPDRIRDGYGSVEHCVPYIECEKKHFHVPQWSRVLIRNFKDLSVNQFGEIGFLQFVSPYITSQPLHSVMMNDAAILYPATDCSIPTNWFSYEGRASQSAAKSCAVSAVDLMGDAHP